MTPSNPLSDADKRALEERGVSLEEAHRQIDLLRTPPSPLRLERPCTPDDGIMVLEDSEAEDLVSNHEEASKEGRFGKFVPASGAASRMFQALVKLREDRGGQSYSDLAANPDGTFSALENYLQGLPRFGFVDDLRTTLRRRGLDLEQLLEEKAWTPLVDGLLHPDYLGYAQLPKALLKFHRDRTSSRTAFEEHLREAAEYVKHGDGKCHLHFTVSPEHQVKFEEHLGNLRPDLESDRDLRFLVGFSNQAPSTDTLALDSAGDLFREPNGELLFRPGGHGALLENLNRIEGDLLYVKNIDNVATESYRDEEIRWKRVLGGLLARLSKEVSEGVRALHEAPGAASIENALNLLEKLRLPAPENFRARSPEEVVRGLVEELDRPLRVCGMVRNTGEPGGGPFWVRSSSGRVTRQIVETAQIDLEDPGQAEILSRSTHFNPVDLVCSVRNWGGKPFDLRRFVDREAVFLAEKTRGGRGLRALERPGLWNGAMAGWITLFVEVPQSTFTPVKTVFDLLRPEHLSES